MSNRKSKTNQLWNQIQPEDLAVSYRTSLQQNPRFHHPQVVDGTASATLSNYDFLAWCSGIRSMMGDQRLKQYVTGAFTQSTQIGGQSRTQMPSNVPNNVREAIQQVSSSQGSQQRGSRQMSQTGRRSQAA